MITEPNPLSTGLTGLDAMLMGLRPGDNVVWQVDGVDDYVPFVQPFWMSAVQRGQTLVYFRFARHRELIPPNQGVEVHRLQPEAGFEKFLTQILDVIENKGWGAFYVFDWLSDLAADWYSDQMLGNFFAITCPYLYDLNTIAYFGLRKNQHSFQATDNIFNTAQVILEVYRKGERLFLHPLKVYQRSSATLYMLHSWEGEEFRPVTSSAITTEILSSIPHPWLDFTIHRLGVWTRTFRQAQVTLNSVRSGKKPAPEAEALSRRLMKMVVTRDERLIGLAEKYLVLSDLIEIMKRMIGTGLIGGKSLGMLLARAILKQSDPRWAERLEAHDSFFIGSDVFYTYLVQNGCWWLRRREKDFECFLKKANLAREKIGTGVFPAAIMDQFKEMLQYFGQSPIIVRSSSLLEDNFGNAFSGKYESVFCANQGTPQERLEAFVAAVRAVYASTMSEEGLKYRLHHGLMDRDEQMALLVQRVSGEMYGRWFFPQMAGVGFSFNPFVWHETIDPQAGVLRIVLGLGTRAVERTEDDYTRLVALNQPLKRIETSFNYARQYCQRRWAVLDLRANQLTTRPFEEIEEILPRHLLEIMATHDEELSHRQTGGSPARICPWVLTFDRLLSATSFCAEMRQILQTLHAAYQWPVDIEFTANFLDSERFKINLVQCRPFQVKVKAAGCQLRCPAQLEADRVLVESHGPIVGQSLSTKVDRLVYVVPAIYGQMSMSQRYSVARLIGRLAHLEGPQQAGTLMLLGPGRWGTSMPSLGIPVSFAEINTVSILGEIAVMREGLVPDVSLGTHFFNDLVEMDMLYLAIFPDRTHNQLNENYLLRAKNRLTELIPNASAWEEGVRVVDSAATDSGWVMYLNVDALKQHALCYVERTASSMEMVL